MRSASLWVSDMPRLFGKRVWSPETWVAWDAVSEELGGWREMGTAGWLEVAGGRRSFMLAMSIFACALGGSVLHAAAARADGWSSFLGVENAYLTAQVSCATTSLCVQVGGSDASVDTGSGWSQPVKLDPGEDLTSVSCPKDSAECVAVDDAGNAFTYSAGGWSSATSADPEGGGFIQVSCPTTTFCMAIDVSGHLATESHGTWTSLQQGEPQAFWGPTDGLESVSCADSDFCVITEKPYSGDGGGSYIYNSDDNSWAYQSSWTWDSHTAVNIDSLSCLPDGTCFGADQDGDVMEYQTSTGAWTVNADLTGYTLEGISCNSDTSCVVVDDYGYSWTYDGSGWTEQATQEPPTTGYPVSISCISADACVAADAKGNVESLNGMGWTAPVQINRNAIAITGISCPTAGFCMVVDGSGDALTFNGASFSAPTAVAPNGLLTVSCSSASFCAAGGSEGGVYTYDGSSWSGPVYTNSLSMPVQSISCGSTALCVALVGYAADQVGANFGQNDTGYVFNGTDWTDTQEPLDSVSCPTASICFGIDGRGDFASYSPSHGWMTLDPEEWTSTGNVLSCTSVSFCMDGAYDAEQAWEWTGSWQTDASEDYPDRGGSLQSLSCTPSDSCVAVDSAGNAVTYDGSTWTSTEIAPGHGLSTVACASASFCLAADGLGSADAFFYSQHETLSVNTDGGNGSGTVTSSPAGLSSGAGSFYAGQSVTLTEVPASGSTFSHWSGACTGAGTTCVVGMDAAESVTAIFTTTAAVPVATTTSKGTTTTTTGDAGPANATAATGLAPLASATPGNATTSEQSRTRTALIKQALDRVLEPNGTANGLKAIAKTHGYVYAFGASGAGHLVIDWRAMFKHRKILMAFGTLTAQKAGSYKDILKLTAAGKELVKIGRAIKITATATFTQTSGKPVSASKSWMLG
jgi:hypothetical protein